MIVLGIEASANKLGVGITKNEVILSNLRKTFIPPVGQGMIPIDAAEHHRSHIFDLISEALESANLQMKDIDLFAYTRGPGMHQLLSVACTVIRTLSLLYKKPLMPVNHCIAHIEMGRLVTKANNPVILYASGGNTQIIAYSGSSNTTLNNLNDDLNNLNINNNTNKNRYKIFGETLDVAVGNCLDKLARDLSLDNYPSPGLSVERAARNGTKYIELPYTIKGMDMSFSGILSFMKNIKNKYTVEDLCYSAQETIFSILVEGTERCLSFVNSNEVMIVGGVGCNLRLQEMMKSMIEQRGGKLYSTDERFCIDNGAMIAYTGYLMYKSGHSLSFEGCDVTQRYRTDTVPITWRGMSTPTKKNWTSFIIKSSFIAALVLAVAHFTARLYMGYSYLDFKYAPIYFTAWRELEDNDLGTVSFIPIKPENECPNTPEVKRYIDLIMPKAPEMGDSPYQDFRPDVFLYGFPDAYRMFKNDKDIAMEKEFLNLRTEFMKASIEKHTHSTSSKDGKKVTYTNLNKNPEPYKIVQDNVAFKSKYPFEEVSEEKMNNFIQNNVSWVKKFNDLIGDIRKYPDNYKITLNDKKDGVEFSSKLNGAIEGLIAAYNSATEEFTIENAKSLVYNIAFAKPTGRQLHVFSRIYYLFLYLHSKVKATDFDTVEMKENQKELDKINAMNITIEDKKGKSKVFHANMATLRTKYINKAFTYLIARMLSDGTVKYPFSSNEDNRNWFVYSYAIKSITFKDHQAEDLIKIEKAVADAYILTQ